MLPKLTSAFGVVAMIGCAWLLSRNRKQFPWRTVLWGMGLQFAFAIFILKTPIGLGIFQGAQVVMDQLNAYAYEGAKMVFGPLGDGEVLRRTFGASGASVFAISVTATIILISSLSSLLYHWGVLQRVVAAMAWLMMKTMRTSGSESLAPREQHLPRPNRSRAPDQALPAEDDAKRNHGPDDDWLLHHCHRRHGCLRRYGRFECGTHSDCVGPGRAGWIADRESNVPGDGASETGTPLPFRG